MLAEVVVETSPATHKVSREGLPEIVGAIISPTPSSGRWNVVEVAELLLEAGQCKVARHLIRGVIASIGDAPLARLFEGYEAYLSFVIDGKISEPLATLERLRVEIAEGGHSARDLIRVAVLQARLLATLAISSADSEAFTARVEAIYEGAYNCALEVGLEEVAATLTIELVRLYICGGIPDGARARAALVRLARRVDIQTLPVGVQLDIKRVIYLCQSEGEEPDGSGELPVIHRCDLERDAAEIGPVAEGLVALSVSRKISDGDTLRIAEERFRGTSFLAGSFEAAYQSGMEAARRGLHIKAKQLFSEAKAVAVNAGFLHGKLIAVHALVTCALRDGDDEGSTGYGEPLKKLLSSQAAKVVIGLPMATHLLGIGDPEGALLVVDMCRGSFRKLKMVREEREALFLRGTILGMLGEWESAQLSIVQSCRNVDKALSVDVVAHRKAALAQAMLMSELAKNPHGIAPSTLQEVRAILDLAAHDVRVSKPADQQGVALARVLLSLSQIASLEKRTMDALGALGEAREIYARNDMRVDIAVVDALTGVSLLDVARHRGAYVGTQLFDESVAAFDRAFEVLRQTPHIDARWKIAYYLAMACHMNSHFKRTPSEQERWHEMAIAWLRCAEEDYREFRDINQDGATMPYEGYQFAVGLSPKVLGELKDALGLKRSSRKRGQARENKRVNRSKRRIHTLH